ncbi:hypothetical protein SC499_19645 [Peribacillus simplex]|nr:hypothetical protein [Peribacillus simplex]MDW7616869.1 hypothetical protein [Peribacillus simplex]
MKMKLNKKEEAEMNCAPFYGQYKKAPKRLICGPGIVPGPFSLAPIDNDDYYNLQKLDQLLPSHPLNYYIFYILPNS